VAGVMVSATDYAERTIHQLEPIRNLFAALFLASIGLIMNPIFLWTHMDVLFASVLVVIVTKVGQRGCGNNVKVALSPDHCEGKSRKGGVRA
jgi:Kef-type K+ transport system membrane component KefB